MVCVVSTFDESINELGIGKQIYNIIIILLRKQAGSMSSTEIEVKKVGENLSQINPYELIRAMNKLIQQLKQQIQEYEVVFENMRKEKQLLLGQNRNLREYNMQLLNKIELLKSNKNQNVLQLNYTSKINVNIYQSKLNLIISPSNKNRKIQSPSLRLFDKHDGIKSGVFDLTSNNNIAKRIQDTLYDNEEDYIPQPIKLNKANQETNSFATLSNTLDTINKKQHIYGENMLEAFVVIGPDITEFKKKRNLEKGKEQITVKPASLYCHGRFYKENKSQFIAEIAKRAFPEGCRLKKKLFQHNQQLIDLIEYKPNRILSEDYFAFTLKGDESLHKSTHENPNLRKSYLFVSNPNYLLFIVCLKLPDFIYIRDQKNYHRKENEIWIGQKIYAVVTYYPFFNIHTEILCRTHSIMSKIMIRRVLIDNQNILVWNIGKTIYDLEKNQEITEMLTYFLTKKPDYNQVCYQSAYYFGTLPEYGFKSLYALSLYCCPIFFSNFSYQEMLLMLTAILCQKTLVFLSKNQTISTLSALFFVNIISPFQYSQTLLLNCDSERVKQMIFEFPFPMICSIKRNENNLEEILSLFAESNVMRLNDDDAHYIIVDVDSNTILYHPVLEKLFTECIVEPDKSIRQAYLAINPCQSKSFSLPKELPREYYKPNLKPKSEIEKRFQEIKKNVKQYTQKIYTNTTKIPTYRRNEKHEQLLKILAEYIQNFTINNENDYEIVKKLQNGNKNNRTEVLKEYLMGRKGNAGRDRIITKFLQSQMYANYLDTILKDL